MNMLKDIINNLIFLRISNQYNIDHKYSMYFPCPLMEKKDTRKNFTQFPRNLQIHPTFFLFHWFMAIWWCRNRRGIHWFRFFSWHLHYSFCNDIWPHSSMDKFWSWYTRRDKHFHYKKKVEKLKFPTPINAS